jgi:hypothetical protein
MAKDKLSPNSKATYEKEMAEQLKKKKKKEKKATTPTALAERNLLAEMSSKAPASVEGAIFSPDGKTGNWKGKGKSKGKGKGKGKCTTYTPPVKAYQNKTNK